jgi:hypothetical protein
MNHFFANGSLASAVQRMEEEVKTLEAVSINRNKSIVCVGERLAVLTRSASVLATDILTDNRGAFVKAVASIQYDVKLIRAVPW